MQNIIAYIDGFNLYYGLKNSNFQRFYWLDLEKLAHQYLRSGQKLVETKYFTSIVDDPKDKHHRQKTYLEALKTCRSLSVFYGKFLKDYVTCSKCNHTYLTHHEKMTDVNIAVQMLLDAHQDRFDVAFLITADSDLVTPIKAIQSTFPHKKVIVIFPPQRFSNALVAVADGYLKMSISILAKSQFPEKVIKPDGFILERPQSWN